MSGFERRNIYIWTVLDDRILDVKDANNNCRTSCFDEQAFTFKFLTPIVEILKIFCRGNNNIVLKFRLFHEFHSVRELVVAFSCQRIISFPEHSLYKVHCIKSKSYLQNTMIVVTYPHHSASAFSPSSSLFLMVLISIIQPPYLTS